VPPGPGTANGRADGEFSSLGGASARTLGAGLVTAILAGNGGRRWCEFTTAPQAAAETFARRHPQTRFLMVHRRADSVVRAIIDASRWGLAGPEFAPFVSAHPASSVVAPASDWVAHTTQQPDFEQAHRQSCLRVRTEDLTANGEQAVQDIGDLLSLATRDVSPWLTQDNGASQSADANPPAAGVPLAQIPAPLLATGRARTDGAGPR